MKRICKNCKHYSSGFGLHQCLHGLQPVKEDPVSGVETYGRLYNCTTERFDPDRCGIEGKYFIHRSKIMNLIYRLMGW